MRVLRSAVLALALSGCGGGGNAPTYSIGGTVSGLAVGGSLVLTDNGTESLTVSANGPFSFVMHQSPGSAYAAALSTSPANQICTLTKGSGTVPSANVTTISVACIGPYLVGGNVAGLTAGASVTLTNNGADPLTVDTNGAFSFPTSLKPGASYLIAIGNLPTGEQCGVTGASGAVAANVTSVKVTCVVPAILLMAGGLGGSGNVDGNGTAARFYYPLDVVSDATGNLFVADDYNATIRKISPSGIVTTLAGSAGEIGAADGVGAAARFNNPQSLALDPAGNIYVADAGANTIRKVSPTGSVTTLAGTAYMGGTADGTGSAAQFSNPASIRWNSTGSLYLNDFNRIRNITTTGVVTSVFTSSTAILTGLAVDATSVVVSDVNTKSVIRIDLGTSVATVLGGGYENPTGICLAPASSPAAGTVYVADEFGNTLNTIALNGAQSVLAGVLDQYSFADGAGPTARFYLPVYMSFDTLGNLLVADAGNGSIRQVTAAGVVTTIAGMGAQPGNVDATGAAARFNNPEAVSADALGNIYVADTNAIRKVTSDGVVTTAFAAGAGVTGFAVDGTGSAYVSQTNLNTIEKIAATGTSTVLAGSPSAGFADGTGAAAQFDHPNGITIDAAGNLFVADSGNRTIRMITPAGVVTTIAGVPGAIGTSDGPAATATFTFPFTLARDADGNVFIADGNAIRKLSAAGVVSTLAGSQTSGASDGSGAAAQFNGPAGITIGPAGSIFVADSQNHTVRKITADGTVTTIAGVKGKAGVALGPLPTTLNVPVGLAYIGSTVYVADAAENSLLAIVGQF
jgi:sugar lactone lactonase YvrE